MVVWIQNQGRVRTGKVTLKPKRDNIMRCQMVRLEFIYYIHRKRPKLLA